MREIGEHLISRRSPAPHGQLPNRRRGAILPLVAMSIIGLMGLMALAVEAGSLHRERRTAQTAADAGATAGAQEIFRLQPKDSVDSAVYYETRRNGFDNGANAVTVTPYYPPASGPHAGDSQFVEVRISRTVSTFFNALLGRNTVTINVRAVAGIPSPSDNCIYTLDPTQEKTLDISQSNVNADCGVVVNSNDDKAMVVESGGELDANSLAVVGGIDQSGGTVYIDPGTTSTGVPPSNDPLGYLTVPPFCSASPNPSLCNANGATHCDYGSPGSPTKVDTYGVTTYLNPGIYCGGIEITSNGIAVLSPGVYVLRGGGLRLSGGTYGTISGTGVTFINTNGNGSDPQGEFKTFYMDSQSNANLSAPTTGDLAGILFFQDPAAGKPPPEIYWNIIGSASGATLTGTLYFPTQRLEFASGSITNLTGGVVAQFVKASSGSTVNMDLTGGLTGVIPVKKATLVE